MHFNVIRLIVCGIVCLNVAAYSHPESRLRIMYWDLSGMEMDQTRREAIESVIKATAPDILVVQYLTDIADTGVVMSAFRETHTVVHDPFVYSSSDGMMIVGNDKVAVPKRTSIGPGMYGTQIGLSFQLASGGWYALLVANWSQLTGEAGMVAHVDNASYLFSIANGAEQTDNCEGRIVVVGTFNAASSSDSGLRYLSYDGFLRSPLVDIAQAEGRWDSVESFAHLHTSSTTAGLTTRSTMAMVSQALLENVRSWFIPGNDGKHYGRSVASGTNDSVSAEMARYLEIASSSLPIVIDIDTQPVSSVFEYRGGTGSLDLR